MAAVEGPSSSTDEVFPGRKAIGIYEQIKTLAPGNQALEIQIVRKKGSFLEGFAEYFTKSNRALEPRYLRKVYYCGALVNGRPSADQERLLREATILRNMDHPNIVRYEDFEWLPTVADKAFLYMEYCQTGDLASYLASQPKADVPLSKNHFWQIFNQLSSALLYCHTGLKAWEEREIWREPLWREPVYHRDVKEANVVISSINEHDIRVKLCDFGFAKGASSNVAGSFVGSRGYIAPVSFL
ncbi:kinase-like domain-containing protein [Rhexocercosporidium sp. MPI-PUGE-AT-0058]|nr:kinase-like domain-containing protein [Rhexocercosporidium sp. MPI-PUGE-AT-0058]